MAADGARVVALSASATHSFSKALRPQIRLIEGIGVEGDAHSGTTVQHIAHAKADPAAPNLRQVHLVHAELLDELNAQGFAVGPGDIGENILTRGIDLLRLPRGTRLHLGAAATVEITGLRDPCRQLDDFENGLMAATLERAADGTLIRKGGVMAVVIRGGIVAADDPISIDLPPEPHEALAPV